MKPNLEARREDTWPGPHDAEEWQEVFEEVELSVMLDQMNLLSSSRGGWEDAVLRVPKHPPGENCENICMLKATTVESIECIYHLNASKKKVSTKYCGKTCWPACWPVVSLLTYRIFY